MIRMFVRHAVSDFGRWQQACDDFDAERRGMGVAVDAVFRAADDPNDVTMWHDFESIDAAKAFAESPRLREVMSAGGVSGTPEVWMTRTAP